MIISVANTKGGVGKTVTAMTLAAYFSTLGNTVLFDGDGSRNASSWAQRGGETFPFPVVPPEQYGMFRGKSEYIIFDTHPDTDDLKTAADIADLVIVPAVPDGTDTDGLLLTVRTLQQVHAKNFRVLLIKVAPDAAKEATDIRESLVAGGVNIFATQIPRLKVFGKAAVQGLIVNQVHDKTAQRAWEYYVAVGKEILA